MSINDRANLERCHYHLWLLLIDPGQSLLSMGYIIWYSRLVFSIGFTNDLDIDGCSLRDFDSQRTKMEFVKFVNAIVMNREIIVLHFTT
jgi:hypothetical protein